jgi:hypothetical protein
MGRAVESLDSEAHQVENFGMRRFSLTRPTFYQPYKASQNRFTKEIDWLKSLFAAGPAPHVLLCW